MNIWELILLAAWGLSGFFIVVCSIPRLRKYQVRYLFGVSHPIGLFLIGVTLLAFSVFKIYQWQTGINPTIIWSMSNGN